MASYRAGRNTTTSRRAWTCWPGTASCACPSIAWPGFGPKTDQRKELDSTEKSWDKLEIRIYPGQDGEFTLYEDELDNYNYEQGLFSTIRFRWDDARRELTIARREGTFPGMLKKRTFNIVLMDAQSADGDRPQRATRTVRYSGKAQTLKL